MNIGPSWCWTLNTNSDVLMTVDLYTMVPYPGWLGACSSGSEHMKSLVEANCDALGINATNSTHTVVHKPTVNDVWTAHV